MSKLIIIPDNSEHIYIVWSTFVQTTYPISVGLIRTSGFVFGSAESLLKQAAKIADW
jgi:hypothetical protein